MQILGSARGIRGLVIGQGFCPQASGIGSKYHAWEQSPVVENLEEFLAPIAREILANRFKPSFKP
jgi:hypothetical protein